MQRRTGLIWMALPLVAAAVAGCSRGVDGLADTADTAQQGPLVVYVVNYPLKYFAERIGGRHVDVRFPAPADEDPAFWRPGPETIAAYQQADLILLNGASYAKWTGTVSLPDTKVVDTTVAVADQFIPVTNSVTHSHGPEGEHAHAGTAFTTWLDPTMASAQAQAIQQALARLRPRYEDAFRENFAALSDDLDALDRELAAVVGDAAGRPIIFSHPVYQYLQRRYHLNARSVHWEPQQVPSSAMWDELEGMLKRQPAQWMVWEAAPIDESIQRLEALGLTSVVFDPCGNVPREGDYLHVMRQNVENLRQGNAENQ